jgi:hypothetical protein
MLLIDTGDVTLHSKMLHKAQFHYNPNLIFPASYVRTVHDVYVCLLIMLSKK